MPNNFLNADISFPTFTADQTDGEKLDVVTNYLYMLLEQLRYTLGNLGAGNFNDAELEDIGKHIREPVYIELESVNQDITDLEITAGKLSSRIENAEGDISRIDQYAKSITMEVSNGDTFSSIKLLADGAVITSQTIHMAGLVTFTGLEDGSTTINGGCIQTGTIDAQYLNLTGAITFSDLQDDVKNEINDAYDMAYNNQLPPYINKTYIGPTEIESPTIYAAEFYGNEFNIYPQSGDSGSFNIFGDTAGGSRYHMLEISYFWSTGAFVDFDSPAGAMARWFFDSTKFYGNIDFSNATVTGL